MSTSKFTLGPWIKDGTFIVGKNNITVASAHYGAQGPHHMETIQANTALIAAAPDLYAALADVLDDLERYASKCGPGPSERLERARRALLQARGEI